MSCWRPSGAYYTRTPSASLPLSFPAAFLDSPRKSLNNSSPISMDLLKVTAVSNHSAASSLVRQHQSRLDAERNIIVFLNLFSCHFPPSFPLSNNLPNHFSNAAQTG
jgi:hypothetical protein